MYISLIAFLLFTIFIISTRGKRLTSTTLAAVITIYSLGVLAYFFLTTDFTLGLPSIVEGIFRAFFNAGAMFSLNNLSDKILPTYSNNSYVMSLFWLIHVLAMLLTATAVIMCFRRVRSRLQKALTMFQPRYIICGVDDNSCAFIRDFRAKRRNGVLLVIDNTADDAIISFFHENNVILQCGDPLDKRSLMTAGVSRSARCSSIYLLAIGNNEMRNMNIITLAEEIISTFEENHKASFLNRAHFYVNTSLENWHDILEDNGSMDVHTFSHPDLTSNHLFMGTRKGKRIFDIGETLKIDAETGLVQTDPRIMFIGTNDITQNILRRSIALCSFCGRLFHATVIGSDADIFMEKFFFKYPALREHDDFKFSFIKARQETAELWEEIRRLALDMMFIVISTGDERTNVNLAFLLRDILSASDSAQCNHILVHCSNKQDFLTRINVKKGNQCSVTFFGDEEELYTYDNIIHEELDRVAKAVNYQYYLRHPWLYNATDSDNSNTRRDSEAEWLHFLSLNKVAQNEAMDQAWRKLSYHEKQSNRYAAMSFDLKLRLLGLYAAPMNTIPPKDRISDLSSHMTCEQKRNLAITEHMRWCAFHYVHGWTPWPVDQATKNKDLIKRKHVCLVPFEDLDTVDHTLEKKIGRLSGFTEMDYASNASIPECIELGGFWIFEKMDVQQAN